MFDLITGHAQHIPRGGRGPVLVSWSLHVFLLGATLTVPLLLADQVLPEVPTIMAFVAGAPAPPPPPPPPPPAAPIRGKQAASTPPSSSTAVVIPVPLEAPTGIAPESERASVDAGVPGGVEGGIPGGVVGGVVGGLPAEAPPPPPPPPPAPSEPIRIGGGIKPPTVIKRVEPTYPALAVAAAVQGVVILEASVSAEGRVTDVKVLRSVRLLDPAAIDAVRQWQYSPVLLNGKPVPFILTVVLTFSLPSPR